jgi:hypothetical protein
MYWFDGKTVIPMRPGLSRPATGAPRRRFGSHDTPPPTAAAALEKYLRSVAAGLRRRGEGIPRAEIEPFFSRIEREEMTAEEVALLIAGTGASAFPRRVWSSRGDSQNLIQEKSAASRNP